MTGRVSLFGSIAERHPQLPLIIDHMGVASDTVKNRTVPDTIAQSAALAKYQNVSVKLSSAPLLSEEMIRS